MSKPISKLTKSLKPHALRLTYGLIAVIIVALIFATGYLLYTFSLYGFYATLALIFVYFLGLALEGSK